MKALSNEAAIAQRDALASMLVLVLAKLVDRRQHMFGAQQSVLHQADALLVEVNG